MVQNGSVKTGEKKISVKGIERSYFNFRPGKACMELQQDLPEKWWIKNKQSPAGTQEEEWRGFTQRTLRVNYSHVESQTHTRPQGAACHLFLEEKTILPRSSQSFLQLFLEEIDASSRVLVSQRIPLQSACAKFQQLSVRKKAEGFVALIVIAKRSFLSRKKPKWKEF